MTANRWIASLPKVVYPELTLTPLPQTVRDVPGACVLGENVQWCYHWGEGPGCRPVPVRAWRLAEPRSSRIEAFRGVYCCSSEVGLASGNSLWPGPSMEGLAFHFSAAMTELVADIISRLPELSHIRIQHLHLGVTRCSRRYHGLLGRITPCRFPGGKLWQRRGCWQITLQRYWLRGFELLYLIAFPIPRFLDLPFEEKMITILHELCHISPRFDGDLQRYPGRYGLHSHSKKAYDRRMALLVRDYLASQPDESKFAFLRLSSRELLLKYSAICGEWLPVPRIIRFLSQSQRDNSLPMT